MRFPTFTIAERFLCPALLGQRWFGLCLLSVHQCRGRYEKKRNYFVDNMLMLIPERL